MSWPARCASGPSWPKPVMRPNTSLGLICEQYVRPEPQPFHDARAGSPSIRASALAASRLTTAQPRLALDVDGERAAAPVQHVEFRLPAGQAQVGRLAPVDADHLGTHVGQQRRRERRRADACHLDDAQTRPADPSWLPFWLRCRRIAPPAAQLACGQLQAWIVRVNVSQCRTWLLMHDNRRQR